MIIRQLLLRQGRRTLISSVSQPWIRFLNTEVRKIDVAQKNRTDEVHLGCIGSQTDASATPMEKTEEPSVANTYKTWLSQQKQTTHLGSTLGPHYEPHALINRPPSPKDVTLELLMASQAHLGHATSLWKPQNQRYIFGIHQGIHIISLDITAAHLRRAAKVVEGVCERGGLVLFVGTREGQDRCVVNAAKLAGGCHLFERWIPGSITNGQQILGRCKMKVVDDLDNELEGYEDQLIDRATLKPDLVICTNPLENYVLLHECGLNGIPTIGIIDTDADPTWVTYPIPANDDSLRCVNLIAGVLGKAGEEGQKRRRATALVGGYTGPPSDGKLGDTSRRSANAN
ncbi:MAG: 37S ribosomal protein, mitochondrial [Trichoglossum hirsutum]|nr:MAG: 37S ribosomal protein, mitochondrial [Trichoglossum hirsutum]